MKLHFAHVGVSIGYTLNKKSKSCFCLFTEGEQWKARELIIDMITPKKSCTAVIHKMIPLTLSVFDIIIDEMLIFI